jgi:hypothetical protein
MTKPRSVAATANDNSIPGSRIKDASITGIKIEDLSLSGNKLQDGTITSSKLNIQTGSIPGSAIEDASITDAKLALAPQAPNRVLAGPAFGASSQPEFRTLTNSDISFSVSAQKYVNVLDFGADPTGATDSTQAFTNAMVEGQASRRIIFMPPGFYLINNLELISGVTFEGANPIPPMTGSGVTELRPSPGNSVFLVPENGVQQVTLRNFRARATGANSKFYTQKNLSKYSAYMVFENLDTYLDFEVTFEGMFIFTRWRNCIDGYNGNKRGSGHCYILAWPGTFNPVGVFNQTNLNTVEDCYMFRAWGVTAGILSATAILAYGWNFSFWRCDFEATEASAVVSAGCNGISFRQCWWEGNSAANLIRAFPNGGDNVQGVLAISFDACYFNLQSLSSHSPNNLFISLAGGTNGVSITNCNFIRVSNDLRVSNSPDRVFLRNNWFSATSSGASTAFLSGSTSLSVFNNNISPLNDNQRNLGSSTNRWSDTFSRSFRPGDGTATWTSGSGAPNGVVTASVGSLYTRTDGAAGTTLYVKESGTGNTGWVAK